jgi:protein-disulfide isomerase
MSKKNQERRTREGSGETAGAGGGGGVNTNWLPIVLSVAALAMGFVAWTDGKQTKDANAKRLVDIDTKIGQMQTMMANLAKAKPAQQQQGPDPNKVYTVKTEGSPTQGNPTAPIVIAEFSDYQ